MSTGELATSIPSVVMVAQAKQMLAECRKLDDVKDIMDKAEALRVYARQQADGLEAQNAAAEIKLRAQRRAGELLAKMEKHKGGRPGQKTSACYAEVLKVADLGVAPRTASNWQAIATLPEEQFEQHIDDTKAADRELTTLGALKLARQQQAQQTAPPPPTEPAKAGVVGDLAELVASGRKFRTVYADPPWQYGNQGTRAATDNHYPTMTVEQICAEPVREVVEDDAHLHLWTTNAFLFDARRVMEAWGFTYKSCFVWVKPQMGIGNYWRVSHEFLLFGVRGSLPFQARDEMSWGSFDRGRHSEKPDAIRQKVEKVSPGPYLEMYGRMLMQESSWTVYGNQVSRRLF